MDKIVSEATSELEASNQRLRSKTKNLMQHFLCVLRTLLDTEVECSKFREENAQLAAALREKTRKQQQTQELYDRIKRKEMAAVTQSAAFNSVDEALGRGNSLHGTSRMHDAQQDRKVANLHQDTPIISRSSTTGAPDGGFGIPNGSRAGEMGPPPRRQPQPLSSSSRLSGQSSMFFLKMPTNRTQFTIVHPLIGLVLEPQHFHHRISADRNFRTLPLGLVAAHPGGHTCHRPSEVQNRACLSPDIEDTE